MKSKFFILFISALLLHKIAFGQDDEVDDSDDSYYLAQFSISSFFERYNSVDVGMLKSINNRGLGFHLGYIYDINSFYEENESNWFKNVNGLKLFLQYRFYIEEGSQYPSNSRTFFEIESAFYYVNFNSERIVGYECSNEFGDCEYYRYFDSEINRFLPSLYLKLGKEFDFDPLVITLTGGLGVRHIFDVSDIPKNPEPDKFFFTNGEANNMSSGTRFNLRLGILVGYKF